MKAFELFHQNSKKRRSQIITFAVAQKFLLPIFTLWKTNAPYIPDHKPMQYVSEGLASQNIHCCLFFYARDACAFGAQNIRNRRSPITVTRVACFLF